jgi:fatty acyl-CoA reductase
MILFIVSFTPGSPPFVVNCTSERNMTMYALVKLGLNITKEIPLENIVWTRNTIFTESNIVFYILTILLHILPAMLVDLILKLCGSKPM